MIMSITITHITAIEHDGIIKKEIKDGTIPDPATIDPATGLPFETEASTDLGKPQMEPDIDGSSTEAPEMPKGGEI